ncbi:MAG TPA: type I-MYXAN CRISPR-associated protein Cas6/Cmx6 [Cyanobacteria bacterium UBA8803]|nr:type I-MYXAN CRISPR-associated protein Cas6/Cmx6 [Cyanobacteria bacterium UBA9273]HBL62915.1 type I-MYXAN CRISPR-associated protein Cas6/Cmx6 [Cyanobacteria bacterium UBA8803]
MIASVGCSASQGAWDGLDPCIELSFPVQGKSIPADHGYALYAALVHHIPELHQQTDLSILTIPGFPDRQGQINLTKYSCFKIRVPVRKIPLVYQLAGKRIAIGKHDIQVGIPEVSVIQPAKQLRSRIVTIKGYTEPNLFLSAARRQLAFLGISGHLSIPLNREGQPSRKTIKIKRYTVVGFSLEVSNLSEEDSLKLQTYGLGGKRRMGCGIFAPYKGGQNV